MVNIHEAKTHFSRLVKRAAAGEEIVIARGGKSIAKLVSLGQDLTPRRPGPMRGRIHLAEDFDATLPPDVLAAFMDGE